MVTAFVWKHFGDKFCIRKTGYQFCMVLVWLSVLYWVILVITSAENVVIYLYGANFVLGFVWGEIRYRFRMGIAFSLLYGVHLVNFVGCEFG